MVDLDLSIDRPITLVLKGDPVHGQTRRARANRGLSGAGILLEDSKARIEAHFQAQGFEDASAPYEWIGDERLRQLVFTVTRGAQRVAEIEFSGNAALNARELDAMVRVERGEPFVAAAAAADAPHP